MTIDVDALQELESEQEADGLDPLPCWFSCQATCAYTG
ncbi:ALQxL family class IV lanthipeptide [Kitasatospora sp. NBC_01266]|nr:ALQxL family class IV lanthipeptide [Kitasatospora sp. NBC_01266]